MLNNELMHDREMSLWETNYGGKSYSNKVIISLRILENESILDCEQIFFLIY